MPRERDLVKEPRSSSCNFNFMSSLGDVASVGEPLNSHRYNFCDYLVTSTSLLVYVWGGVFQCG